MANKPVKTKLTRKDVEKLLELYNFLDNTVDNVLESLDIDISTLSKMQSLASDLQHMFDIRPAMDEDGRVERWRDKVLPDDDNAWFYEEH
tara:strand:- start:413 stop:682 length:270 start_codon:yes stop_codon:yes gene_type:complete